jgi:hypothetical protein
MQRYRLNRCNSHLVPIFFAVAELPLDFHTIDCITFLVLILGSFDPSYLVRQL